MSTRTLQYYDEVRYNFKALQIPERSCHSEEAMQAGTVRKRTDTPWKEKRRCVRARQEGDEEAACQLASLKL